MFSLFSYHFFLSWVNVKDRNEKTILYVAMALLLPALHFWWGSCLWEAVWLQQPHESLWRTQKTLQIDLLVGCSLEQQYATQLLGVAPVFIGLRTKTLSMYPDVQVWGSYDGILPFFSLIWLQSQFGSLSFCLTKLCPIHEKQLFDLKILCRN